MLNKGGKRIMSKEITCRMVDGKPVVEYKEEYVPKKGDIVKVVTDNRIVLAVHDRYNCYQAIACLGSMGNPVNIKFILNDTFDGMLDSHAKATPEEAGVMHHILSENGYELKGDTVVKKRWIPKMGETYWEAMSSTTNIFVDVFQTRRDEYFSKSKGIGLFKTKAACQSACDKLNEFILTLPQE